MTPTEELARLEALCVLVRLERPRARLIINVSMQEIVVGEPCEGEMGSVLVSVSHQCKKSKEFIFEDMRHGSSDHRYRLLKTSDARDLLVGVIDETAREP